MKKLFQGQEVIEISCVSSTEGGTSTALISPENGGLLLRWTLDGREVIYWPEPANWDKPVANRGGNPLLFPFIGRTVLDGKPGMWRDTDGAVYPINQHGFARNSVFAYEVDEDGAGLRMLLRDSAETLAVYPYPFEFEVAYRLEQDTLIATMVVRNTGTRSMPYYAGHHFYFAVENAARATTELWLPPGDRYVMDANAQPQPDADAQTPSAGTPHEYRLDNPALQDRFHTVHAGDAHPYAEIEDRATGRVICLDLKVAGSVPWPVVNTWSSSPDANSFCVEPWLGVPNSVEHGFAIRQVAAGAEETAICRITVTQQAWDASLI